DDAKRLSIEPHVQSHDVRALREAAFPQGGADDHHRMRARGHVVAAGEQSSAMRADTQHLEEIPGDDVAAHEIRGLALAEAHRDPAERREASAAALAAPHVVEGGIREDAGTA